MNCVLITIHPMLGLDAHSELGIVPPAPAPVPSPFHPHIVGATLRWLLRPAMAESVQSWGFSSMQRGTDIQSGIPHIPIPPAPFFLCVPVCIAFSGSKSHFGVASVLIENKPVAVAVAIIINVNLNCGDIPTPTGFVIAPNTVVAQMTFADWLGGVFSMAFDCVVQAVLNKILPNGWAGGIIGVLIGTPLGFSANASGSGDVGRVGRVLGSLNDYVRGVGESLGGDSARGQANRNAATRALLTEARDAAMRRLESLLTGPGLNPSGWNIGNDARTIFDRPIQGWNALPSGSSPTAPSPSSSTFDSPHAEQF